MRFEVCNWGIMFIVLVVNLFRVRQLFFGILLWYRVLVHDVYMLLLVRRVTFLFLLVLRRFSFELLLGLLFGLFPLMLFRIFPLMLFL